MTCGFLSATLTCDDFDAFNCGHCAGCCADTLQATQRRASPPAAGTASPRAHDRVHLRVRKLPRPAAARAVPAAVVAHEHGSNRTSVALVEATAVPAPDVGSSKYCCYSKEHPRSYCKLRKSPACALARCLSRPPCRHFCRASACEGCPGPAVGDVSAAVNETCALTPDPQPVCGGIVEYAMGACAAEAMCYVQPGTPGTAAPPARGAKAVLLTASGVERTASTLPETTPAVERAWVAKQLGVECGGEQR